MLFRAYDVDGDDRLSRADLVSSVKALQSLSGPLLETQSGENYENAEELVEELLQGPQRDGVSLELTAVDLIPDGKDYNHALTMQDYVEQAKYQGEICIALALCPLEVFADDS